MLEGNSACVIRFKSVSSPWTLVDAVLGVRDFSQVLDTSFTHIKRSANSDLFQAFIPPFSPFHFGRAHVFFCSFLFFNEIIVTNKKF